jgi:outer membrane murein-binding lipoprotein Lpp
MVAMVKTRIKQMFRIESGRELFFGIVLGVIGAAVAGSLLLLGGDIQPTWNPLARWASPSNINVDALKQLEKALATEVLAREELAAHIAVLDEKIAGLTLTIDEAGVGSLAVNGVSSDSPMSDEIGSEGSDLGSEQSLEASQFDDEALLSLGAHPSDVDRLHDHWVRHELEIASISDQAMREGWFNQQRHRAEMIRSELTLRRDLQDPDYDRYLYALGKPNRVAAGEILANSAASEAGLRRGDIILSYDDVRVFRPSGLVVASSAGELGRSVPMEILRDGRPRTLYIERGPPGALTNHIRVAPGRD